APETVVRLVHRPTARTRFTLWCTRLGWRHVVMWLVAAFAVFPVLFVISAALNPVGTLSSSQLWPTGASFDNALDLFRNTPFTTCAGTWLLSARSAAAAPRLRRALAAYAFSRMRVTGGRGGLVGPLVLRRFPPFLAIVAIYLMSSNRGEIYPVIGFDTGWG